MADVVRPRLPAALLDSRVLLVDDQELNLSVLRRVLTDAGLRDVLATTNPHEVAGLVERHRPDLVIVDLRMPGLDGFGVMASLRPHVAEAGYLPILVLTADLTDDARRQALEAGARDFLTKPIDPIEVVLRARNLLEMRALYVELARRNEDLEQRVRERTAEVRAAHLDTLERLARTAEFRDDSTGRHVVRVGRLSAVVARAMGMDEQTVRLLRFAAPLHDVGKIGIADAILLAPRKLTPEEFETMKAHTRIGSMILAGSSSTLLQLAERIAMTHHERWDGTGYHGMVGADIPMASRIVGLADVFDALTHERPYKHAWPVDEAVDEIARGVGRHFDPAVAEAFGALDHAALVDPVEPIPGADAWGLRGPAGRPA